MGGTKIFIRVFKFGKIFNLFLRWNFWWSLPYFDRATYLRIRVWRAKKGIPKFFSCCGLFFIMVTIKTVKNHFKPLKFSKTVKKGPQNFLPLPGFFYKKLVGQKWGLKTYFTLLSKRYALTYDWKLSFYCPIK